ncbi:MAG: hypothetical protein R3B81_09480 [bacterium]
MFKLSTWPRSSRSRRTHWSRTNPGIDAARARALRGVAAVALLVANAAASSPAAGAAMDPPAAFEGPSRGIERSAVGSAFTYQGELIRAGSPANGLFDFQFRLMDAVSGGAQIGATVSIDDATVADGRFTASLDFGVAAFGGGARWLEISVRPGNGSTYTLLAPRQALTPAPYAAALPNVYTNDAANFVGVGRSTPLVSTERFAVHGETGPGSYGGMYVDTSDPAGLPYYGFGTGGTIRAWTYFDGGSSTWRLYNGGYRLSVGSGAGLVVEDTSVSDGIQIHHTSDDGLQIGTGSNYPIYGVYIPSPGVPNIDLLVYTSNASGNYALYTTDNIEAGTVTLTAQKVIARVDAVAPLDRGVVVAAAGVGDPIEGGSDRLPAIRAAGPDASGVVGVLATRLDWELAPGKEAEGEIVLMPAEGPARPGDLVAIITQGVADVLVQPGARVTRGARLTADDVGVVRPLRAESLNGMSVTEGAPVVGVALADANGGTVPVFVNVH